MEVFRVAFLGVLYPYKGPEILILRIGSRLEPQLGF